MIQIDSLMPSIPHPLKMLISFWRIFLQISLVLSFSSICYSQNASQGDSLEYQAQVELFDEAIGIENTGIINGAKYTVPLQISDTHPFYNSRVGAKGNVTFVEQPYFNLILLYDIYSDELIVQQSRATGVQALIKLYKSNVESFKIHDHTFRNYQDHEAQKLGMVSGFYDVLYENAIFTLIARRKKITHVATGDKIQYENEDHYFFIHNGRFTPFRGMKSFYRVLGDKDLISELKSFVSKNNLKIKKSDSDLIRAARNCDTILNKRK